MFPYFNEGSDKEDVPSFDTPRDMNAFMSDDSGISQQVSSPNVSLVGGYKKSKWTPAEDRALVESVKIHGTKNWIAVSTLVPGRNSKQCRERWTAQLDPTLNHNEFTPQEDAIIIFQHQANGPIWAKIATFLPGRSATAVKNRFNWLSRRHLPQKMNKFFFAGTTPNEPSFSGSLSSLGLAPYAFSDPQNEQSQIAKNEEKGNREENIFGDTFFNADSSAQNNDMFDF